MKITNRALAKMLLLVPMIFAPCINNLHGIMVSQHAIKDRARELAHQYLERKGFSSHSIPSKLTPEYEHKLDTLTQELINRVSYEGRSYADLTEIEDSVSKGLRPFVRTLKTLVLSYDLDIKIQETIQQIAQEKGVITTSLPFSMVSEFNRKKANIGRDLRNMMANDGRNYVRLSEIEKQAHKELDPFFSRVNKENPNWFYNLFGFNNQAHSNGSSSNKNAYAANSPDNAVKRAAIDQKSLEVCNKILQEFGITPNNIAARIVSDYSAKVQVTIKRVKNGMGYWQSTVSIYDIEAIAREELQSVIDKIQYKGEICVICQDNYKSQERVGILSCNHSYHKDCIYTWLETNKSCPLCRQQGVIVAKQEFVP